VGCATKPDSSPSRTTAHVERLAGTGKQEGTGAVEGQLSEYEEKRVLKAKDLVRSEFLQGEHHTVDETVRTDGFTNTYSISSEYGSFEAHGAIMLPIRVHEIDVIATLRDLPKRTGYVGGVADAVTRPVRGT